MEVTFNKIINNLFRKREALDNVDGANLNQDMYAMLVEHIEENLLSVKKNVQYSAKVPCNKFSVNVFVNLCRRYNINIKDVEIEESTMRSLGYIGPGLSCLTTVLEFIFGWSKTFRLHAVLHDAFGAFYRLTGNTNGYCYRFKSKSLPLWLKSSPLIGHITGLYYCYKILRS